jgi:hypothetical protein
MNVLEVLDTVVSVVGAEDEVVPVIVIGRDAAAAALALALANRVAGNFEDGLEFEISAWTFGMLRLAQIQELAVARAAEADIVIVAGMAGEEPPAELKQCLDEATRRRGARSRAVVALTDRPEDSVSPKLCQYLHGLCQDRAEDTFVCSRSLPTDERELTPDRLRERERVCASLAAIESVVRHPLAERHFLVRYQAWAAPA